MLFLLLPVTFNDSFPGMLVYSASNVKLTCCILVYKSQQDAQVTEFIFV